MAFEVVQLLLQHGAQVDAKDIIGHTALHQVAENDQIRVLLLLLEHEAPKS
jgi:ankyrin repeat protein